MDPLEQAVNMASSVNRMSVTGSEWILQRVHTRGDVKWQWCSDCGVGVLMVVLMLVCLIVCGGGFVVGGGVVCGCAWWVCCWRCVGDTLRQGACMTRWRCHILKMCG